MKISITLYDALVAANVPAEKAKAVVDAWEADVEQLATKADLQQLEVRLKALIAEVCSEMKVMRWQLCATFICVLITLIKTGFDLVAQVKL